METTKQKSRYGVKDFCRDEKIYREEIVPRMKELLDLNPYSWDDPKKMDFDKRLKRQETLMRELDTHAYNARSMSGRTIQFPMADSYAVYLVTQVNKTTCRVVWINFCDGWQDDRLGEEGSLPLDYVHEKICRRDNMKKLFS